MLALVLPKNVPHLVGGPECPIECVDVLVVCLTSALTPFKKEGKVRAKERARKCAEETGKIFRHPSAERFEADADDVQELADYVHDAPSEVDAAHYAEHRKWPPRCP